jgi:hypothetical protein
LRYLETLTVIAADKNSTIVFPLPMDIIGPLVAKLTGEQLSAGVAASHALRSYRTPHALQLLQIQFFDVPVDDVSLCSNLPNREFSHKLGRKKPAAPLPGLPYCINPFA